MKTRAPKLSTVAWVRFANAHICSRSHLRGKAEVSVEYRFDDHVTDSGMDGVASSFCECQKIKTVSSASTVAHPSVQEFRTCVPFQPSAQRLHIFIHDAEEGFEDARPVSMWVHPQTFRLRSNSLQLRPLDKNSIVSWCIYLLKEAVHVVFMLAFVAATAGLIWEQSGMTRLRLISGRE